MTARPSLDYIRVDLLVFGKVVVEIKAMDRLTSRDDAQLLSTLKATGLEVGLLINFGAQQARMEAHALAAALAITA